jgi:hypothetical protein
MKRALLVTLAALFLASPVAADALAPNLAGIVGVSGRFGMAHVCPVAADLAVTNAHVIDPFPTHSNMPLVGLRWDGGWLTPLAASSDEDLALVTPRGDTRFSTWYPVAENPPTAGEQLWWQGFDWRSPGRSLQRMTFSGRVAAVSAGAISLDSETPSGSSGSCVLNSDGEVVAVIAWAKEMENGSSSTFAVSVWGSWFNMEAAKKALAAWKEKAVK